LTKVVIIFIVKIKRIVVNETSTTILKMKRVFNSASDQVSHAWTTPKIMKKWLFTGEKN
jgi:uncharacterized protein YndB with AHSA1/START domain